MTAPPRSGRPPRIAAGLIVVLAWACLVAPASAAAPAVRSPAAVLVQPATGDVVFARRADQERPIASTTKLMTALLTLERARLSQTVSAVNYHALAVESTIGLRAGERMTIADLLRGLLVASANDAAATLAVRVGGSQRAFVAMMNARARALGLAHTHYTNPVGLDEGANYSSATDLVKLTLILRRNAFFRAVTDSPRVTLRSGARSRTLTNRNTLVRTVAQVNGVKTGHTQKAGYVLVGSATAANGVTVVSAVLGAPSEAVRDADSLALLRYGLRSYRRVTALRRGQVLARVGLDDRDERAALVATRTIRQIARRGERVTTTVRGVPASVDGPLPQGTRLGTVSVRFRGRTIARVPLVTRDAIAEASVLQRADNVLGRTLLVAVAVVAALASLQLVFLRRRAVRRRRARETGIA